MRRRAGMWASVMGMIVAEGWGDGLVVGREERGGRTGVWDG